MNWKKAVEKSKYKKAFRMDGRFRIEIDEDGAASLYAPSGVCERMRSRHYEKYVYGFTDWKPL